MLPNPEAVSPQHRRDRDDARDPRAADRTGVDDDLALLLLAEQDAHRGEQDQRRERVDDPVETREQKYAERDEDRAHGEGSQHAPIEHAPLFRGRDLELGEDQDEDEDVVDRERLLERIRGVIEERVLGAVEREDDPAEPEPQADPGSAPKDSALERQLALRPPQRAQIEREHRQYKRAKERPDPPADNHGITDIPRTGQLEAGRQFRRGSTWA